ncbi:Tic20 family membrane protein [Halalkaliarchaeum sp. AArc-CO]|uniref:DUF4870 domain-containing protein n=1 Tax=unclassified Halalkaliarchaeum TaxID=2678344 RepID=UPI00217CDFAF|nr:MULTISPECIES: DUF4870 domain-containing protein [unclassified Halalkaliarchaeum]MDR5672923.1 hypothetical protein [Halalkaliarchaeum sp. AArc-GB]UWG50272.1 Tic20 family membrane protein [Halalkaliarchaeum sp. AArc-CO]
MSDHPDPARSTVLGLDRNLAGALAYSVTFLTGLVFYLVTDDEYVRFHAAQSVVAFGSVFALVLLFELLGALLGTVSALEAGVSAAVTLVSSALGLAAFVLWLLLMVKAGRGERFKLPLLGTVAERFV